MDILEAVIGIGKNLFFNSPMEACIIICRMKKDLKSKGKVLFINAKNELTRKNTESYLEEEHITKIANTYLNFDEINQFSKVVNNKEILEKEASLSVNLYVNNSEVETIDDLEIESALDDWFNSSTKLSKSINTINNLLKGEVKING